MRTAPQDPTRRHDGRNAKPNGEPMNRLNDEPETPLHGEWTRRQWGRHAADNRAPRRTSLPSARRAARHPTSHLRGMRDDGHRTEGIRHRLGKTIDTPHDCGQGQILRIRARRPRKPYLSPSPPLQEVVPPHRSACCLCPRASPPVPFHARDTVEGQSQCLQTQPVL